MTYSARVSENLLPLSVNRTLPAAFTEWYFTEHTHDHDDAIAECQLCDKEQLRYHFEIANRYTRKTLWVGSTCILRFEVAVYGGRGPGGEPLPPKDAKRHLDNLMKKMQLDACIAALEKVSIKENNVVLKGALEYYTKNKCLTPKHASIVFWRLKANNVDFRPSFFKVSLSKDRHKAQIREMDQRRIDDIWPALTAGQRKVVERIRGRKAPDFDLLEDYL